MIESVTVQRHGDGFLRVIADGEEMSRALTLDQAVTWVANLLLVDEGAHVTVERYPAAGAVASAEERGSDA
jgi:hypothetical protein